MRVLRYELDRYSFNYHNTERRELLKRVITSRRELIKRIIIYFIKSPRT